jgi:hypothetical protein
MGYTLLPSSAAIFSLDSQSRLFEVGTNYYPNTDASGLYYVYQETLQTVSDGGYAFLTCKAGEGGECAVKGREGVGFWWCPVIGPPDALVAGSEADRVEARGWDCIKAGVTVECV